MTASPGKSPAKEVRLEHITKVFDSTLALAGIDLSIKAGELFFILGPSGCGKSTLLRLIAGLHEPTSGRIFFDGKDVTAQGTELRNAVMCFQSYALWPHMTVRENVAFGLEVRKFDRAARTRRVDEVLRQVRMEGLADRKPTQLSGGQQQRVALARALAVEPACLLLDEPLSNLDAKLRHEMRTEIRDVCKSAGLTTIYVTHDQKEALSVADRLAVLDAGRVAQVGTPAQMYHDPVSSFVAEFIGSTNLLPGKLLGRDDAGFLVDTKMGTLIGRTVSGASPGAAGDNVILSIRPEQMRVIRGPGAGSHANVISGRPIQTTFLGEASEHVLDVNGGRLKVTAMPPLFDVPSELTVTFESRDAIVLRE